MRISPKISVSPTPRKNSRADCDSALTVCVSRRARVLIAGSAPLRGAHARSTQRCATEWRAPSDDACLIFIRHLVAFGRRLVAREGRDHFRHRRVEARLLLDLDHEALLHALVVALAHEHLALDALDLDVLERRPELGGLDAARLRDAGLEHLHALPLLALERVGVGVVLLLPRRHELVV